MTRLRRVALQVCLLIAIPNLAVAAHTLTVHIVDAASGLGTAARIGVFDGQDQPLVPQPPRDYMYQNLGARSYFYAADSISLTVPDGTVTVYATKGFEHEPVTLQLDVGADTTVTVSLQRWIDPRANGWFTGETHTHLRHSPVVYPLEASDMMLMMNAEDLHFANVMDDEAFFTGGAHALSSSNRILYFGKEYRNPHFGHLTLVGLKSWVPTVTCSWEENLVCGRVLNGAVADAVQSQGGTLVIATHVWPPPLSLKFTDLGLWPGQGIMRALPLDLAGGHYDAMDILGYTHRDPPEGLIYYERALNAGSRLPTSAGTDAILSSAVSFPPGGFRVYVKTGATSGDFNESNWIEGLRAGRTFVSNMPIFTTFDVAGHGPGDVIQTTSAFVSGSFEVRCALPMERVDIVADGDTIQTFPATGDGTVISGVFSVPTDTLMWIAARAVGAADAWHVIEAPGLFAQTGPVYVERTDTPPEFAHPKKIEAAACFLDWTDDLVDLYDGADFPDNSQAAFDSAVAATLDYFQNIVPDPPLPFALLVPMGWSPLYGSIVSPSTRPTFRWQSTTDADSDDVITYTLCYGTDSTFAVADTVAGLTVSLYEVPQGSPLLPLERYFWKVTAHDGDGYSRSSTPAQSDFIVDVNATGVADGRDPRAWEIESVRPNPFNPSVRVRYHVPAGNGYHAIFVHDVTGRVVRPLFAGVRAPGAHSVEWDGRNSRGEAVASGVYFVRISPAAQPAMVRKIVLIR